MPSLYLPGEQDDSPQPISMPSLPDTPAGGLQAGLEEFLAGCPDPLLLLDDAGRVRGANPAWRRWWGEPSPRSLDDLTGSLLEPQSAESWQPGASPCGLRLPGGAVRTVRLRRVPLAGGTLLHAVDLTADLAGLDERLRQARAEVLLDLFGGAGHEDEAPLAALAWLASRGEGEILTCPEWLQGGLLRARTAARRLTEALDRLRGAAGETGAGPLRLLLAGGDAAEAARVQDRLAGEGLPARVRTAEDEAAVLRAARAMATDAVLLDPALSGDARHALVLELSRSCPGLPVFDLAGVRWPSLALGLRRRTTERRREERLAATWGWLEDLALRDPLTGLLNRRAFERAATAEVAQVGRYRVPLALAILDLDRFKEVNDRYGHLEGDRVLQAVGSALAAGARDADLVARLGGDEFAVLMPHTALAGGRQVALRLVQVCRELLRSLLPQMSPPAGASAGVAVLAPGARGDLQDLLRRADEDLYRVKRARAPGGDREAP